MTPENAHKVAGEIDKLILRSLACITANDANARERGELRDAQFEELKKTLAELLP